MIDIIAKKTQAAQTLELICQALELSQTQYDTAKSRYEAVGKWLSGSDGAALRASEIYPQGSVSLGTTVKPLEADEFDVDLVCRIPFVAPHTPPSALKQLIGNRLRASGHYKDILEEKPRCWRINYANEFHLDITPSVPNAACTNGGELVPDKKLKEWKPSNPRGYRSWFEERALIVPRVQSRELAFMEARAAVEEFPKQARRKGLLRRAVQIIKRHRDMWACTREAGVAPISIILTTLAAKSYVHCAGNFSYETEYDLLVDIVRYMPNFIENNMVNGREHYFIWNDTTAGENFAEKWNQDERLVRAFYAWQLQATTDLENLPSLSGLDQVRSALSSSFGDSVVSKVMGELTASISAARTTGALGIVPRSGLSATGAGRIVVPSNTFFGS